MSGNSAKNGSTSRAHNFVKNGRASLVYDSFLSQGPPRLKKTGLGWFPRLARPLRADLRNFIDFSGHPAILNVFSKMLKKSTHKFQSVVKTSKTIFMTQ